MIDDEEEQSTAATVEAVVNTQLGCIRNDCPVGKCQAPLVCIPLWEDFICKYVFKTCDCYCKPVYFHIDLVLQFFLKINHTLK